ncbi:MAG: SDR family oxidoreductase [Clostridiaceae bacterium]|nr:SDR family oxidoreductase [Clostridiaceae bacterium]
MELFDLTGKTAIITGGGGGIGSACAKALAKAGAQIVLVDKEEEYLASVKESMLKDSLNPLCLQMDIADSGQVNYVIDETIKKFGNIDIFINSAAVHNRTHILSLSEDEWRKVIDINLNSAFYMSKQVAAKMVEHGKGGKIIFIVSTGAFRASVNYGAYSVSKAGVVMLMKTLALELAQYKINVNAIAPTATDTRFTRDYYYENPDKKIAVINNHPFGRIAVPEDYAGTALYLASSASDFVTGTTIVVDGGKTAK